MSNLCVIPARGGSKRIPRKNIKDFCGKPIIAYSIQTALQSGLFDDVVVSTDDAQIAEVAKEYGASVPFFRDKSLADDFTGTTPVVANAIKEMQKLGKNYQFVCCIYATSPFLKDEFLKDAYKKLKESNKEFAFSICEFNAPIFRSFKKLEDSSVEMFWSENFNKRSQDLPKAYFDAAQFYFGRPDAFLNNLQIFAPHSIGIELPRELVQDIDTLNDWVCAQAMFKALSCK